MLALPPISFFFFFNDTATTEIYTLSLHDALPICGPRHRLLDAFREEFAPPGEAAPHLEVGTPLDVRRSEEHTSELQSLAYLVCRLLLEKKKKKHNYKFAMETTHNETS